MTLDFWLLGLVGVFGALGAIGGGLKQASQWAGLALAYLLSGPLARAAGPQGLPGLPRVLAPVALRVLLMLLIYIVASLALRAVLRKVLPGGEKTRADRLAGFAMGAAKGAAIVWILLSVLTSFAQPLAKAGWDLDKEAGPSRALALARRHNLFATVRVPAIEGAKKLAAAMENPGAAAGNLDSPALKAALEDPKIKAALSDPSIQAALRANDPAALLQDPKIQGLLDDPDLAKKLEELQELAPQE